MHIRFRIQNHNYLYIYSRCCCQQCISAVPVEKSRPCGEYYPRLFQLTFTSSKSTIEDLEKVVKYVQS